MKVFVIVLLSLLAFLLLSFLLFLFLIGTGKRKGIMDKYKGVKYAHRGLHDRHRAENSMSAFRAAVEAGFGIELDVRLSSDGELVVFHDDTLDRMTKEKGRVDSRTAKELSEITLGDTSDTVPLFSEVLKMVGGRVPLLVEIKEDQGKYGVTEKTAELLRDYKGEFIIESFNPLALARVKKLMPEVARGFLSQNFLSDKKYRGVIYFLLQNLLTNVLCRPDFIAYNHRDYKNSPLKLVRTIFDVPTFAWTVRSESEERAAKSHGFDSVIFEGYTPKK